MRQLEGALSESDRTFLKDVRTFIDVELDPQLRAAVDNQRLFFGDHHRSNKWVEKLRKRHWHVAHWPKNHGGLGLSPLQNYLLLYEQGIRGAPLARPFGFNYVGPTVMRYGTEAQKTQILNEIAECEVHWCQGFSEPGSGSDLASVATFAERRGDAYVINGSKMWTTDAQYADRMFCLVRTRSDTTKSALSFVLIDMHSPGITVQPIRLTAGDHELNQVFFDDVEILPEHFLGEEGAGWEIARFLLEIERGAFVFGGRLRRRLERLIEIARERAVAPRIYDELARIDMQLLAYECTELRLGHLALTRDRETAAASIVKIEWTEILQQLDQLAVAVGTSEALYTEDHTLNVASRLAGEIGMPGWLASYFNNRAASIYGGSNEIQRNLIYRGLRQSGPDWRRVGVAEVSTDLTRTAFYDSARRFVADNYPAAEHSANADESELNTSRWLQMVELGWLATTINEQHGGLGLGYSYLSVLAEALGPSLIQEPLISQLALVGEILDNARRSLMRDDILSGWLNGSVQGALADAERRDGTRSLDTTCTSNGDGVIINGKKCVVIGGGHADYFIVSCRAVSARDAQILVLVPANSRGVSVVVRRAFDGQSVADVAFVEVSLNRSHCLEFSDPVPTVLGKAHALYGLLLASESVGISYALLHRTHNYLLERRQFGQALAEFQALQHRISDMLLRAVRIESLVALAREQVDSQGLIAATESIAAANYHAAMSARRIAEEAVQLHGAIGMTAEYIVGDYLKRLIANEYRVGNNDKQLTRFMNARQYT